MIDQLLGLATIEVMKIVVFFFCMWCSLRDFGKSCEVFIKGRGNVNYTTLVFLWTIFYILNRIS